MNALNSKTFPDMLTDHKISLTRKPLEILQVNLGKICNQACSHCHVEAGPKRTEIMSKVTIDRILELLEKSPDIQTIDITGGAPELNPHFKYLVLECRRLKKKIIDRCNLTILLEKDQENTAKFLSENCVEIIASLPCYSKKNVEKQRGKGVFDKSIKALLLLNSYGYGQKEANLSLNLVYNPLGDFLPPAQDKLEQDYKRELKDLFGIDFNNLYTITNMPIKRFLNDLKRNNKLQNYMTLLINHFNPKAATKVMCRNLVSVSWDGFFYDCDFNQMLEIGLGGKQITLWDIENFSELIKYPIALDNHCYGCTAGSGSSCGGTLT